MLLPLGGRQPGAPRPLLASPGTLWVEPHVDGARAAVIPSQAAGRGSLVLLVNFFDLAITGAG